MDTGLNIPLPVSYSPLKHHFHYQLSFIREFDQKNTGILPDKLIVIGNNATDVYCGSLTVEDLSNEIAQFIADQGIHERENLISWLGEKGYREVIVADGSRWVARLSENEERFLHIHPGKKSLHTFRLRGTTLKTVLALCIMQVNQSGNIDPDVLQVNRIRKELLGLSPVKNLSESSRIIKWQLFYIENIRK